MDLVEAQWLARDMMEEHGLLDVGWGFQFDRAVSRLGATHFHKKLITLSKHMVAAADEETVRQTMLHEIAHAKLPRTVKPHGPEWKALAKSLGYTGKRTAHNPYEHNSKRGNTRTSLVTSHILKPVDINTQLRLKGDLTGVVFKKARTRWHVKASDGRIYSVPFSLAEKLVI